MGRCIISTVHATSMPRTSSLGLDPQFRLTLEVSGDDGINGNGGLAARQHNPQTHAIRKRRHDDAVEDGSRRERLSLHAEVLQPGPPAFELLHPFDPGPHLQRRAGEVEGTPVRNDGSAWHTP